MQTNLVEGYSDGNPEMELDDLMVKEVGLNTARMFMEKHHYTGSIGNAAMSWGAYDQVSSRLVSVISFHCPISENVRDSIFGSDVCGCRLVDPKECNRDDCDVWGNHHHLGDHVTELHRLATIDEAPKNTGSWIISEGLKRLKKKDAKYWAVVSFADTTEGHIGIQYQGSNFDFYGTTDKRKQYIDNSGNLVPTRRNGENISEEEARGRGWEVVYRDIKLKYIKWLPYRSMRSVEGLREFSEIDPYKDYPPESN